MSLAADESAPFRYECSQSIAIRGDSLSIELRARNLGEHRIPLGLGLHPYFANRSDARIKAALPTRWLWDQEMMPVRKAANPVATDLLRQHRVADLPVAAEYADWDGSAAIDWPATRLRVELKTQPPLRHAVFWMPAGKDFFCFEPVMHATDALNRHPMRDPAEDFLILEPGAVAQQRFDFVVSCPDVASCPESHSP
jgi:aldose 1-epimerase